VIGSFASLTALGYMKAVQARAEVAVTLSMLLSEYDLLVTPTLPIAAFEAGMEVPPTWPHRRLGRGRGAGQKRVQP